MRFLLLLITYILLAENALAQRAVVGLPNMTVVYIGLQNPIEVAVDGVKAKDLVVQINGGELKGENGKYVFIPNGSNRLAILKVGYKKRNKINWVDSVEYRVRKTPKPELLFGLKSGGKMSRGELLTVSQMNAGMREGFVFEGIKFKVTSYRFLLITDQNLYIEEVKGAKLTSTIRQKLQDINNGGFILIDNAIAQSDHTTEKLKPAIFSIDGQTFVLQDFILQGNEIDTFGNKIFTKSVLSYNYSDIQFSSESKKDGLWQLLSSATGKPIAEYFYDFGTLRWNKLYYPQGMLNIHKMYNSKTGIASYIDYYQNGSVYRKGNFLVDVNFDLVVDKDCSFNRSFKKEETCELYGVGECLLGKWEVFHPNGKLKETGNMDTTGENTFYIVCNIFIPDDVYEQEKEEPLIFPVRHGLWKFYDEKGKLIRQTVYDKGHIKEP